MFSSFRRRAGLTARPIDATLAGRCAALHATSFAHGWSAAEFERLLASEACAADGAFAGVEFAGFILSRQAADEAEILTVAVDPKFRRQGAGRILLSANLARLAARGATRLFLEVAEDNVAALALYRSFGFREEGRRKGYYRRADGEPVSAFVMARDLG